MAQFANLHLTPNQCACAWLYGRFRFTSSARWMDLMAHFDRVAREAIDGKRSADETASFLIDDRSLDRLHNLLLDIQENDGLTGSGLEVVNAIIAACQKASEMIA